MFLIIALQSLATYFEPPKGEPKLTQMQDELRLQISLRESVRSSAVAANPAISGTVSTQVDEGLREILMDAKAKAGSSDEAARIAVVTANELGEDLPWNAVDRLEFSKDKTSQAVFALVVQKPVDDKVIEKFSNLTDGEFAAQLALAQARELLGEENARDAILIKNVLLKSSVLSLFGGLAVVGGLVAIVLFFFARSRGRLRPTGFAHMTQLDGDRYMVRFAVYQVGYILISITVGLLLARTVPGVWANVMVVLATLFLTVAFFYVPVFGAIDSWRRVLGSARPLGKNVSIGLYGYLAAAPLVVVSVWAMDFLSDYLPAPTHPITDEIRGATSATWVGVFVVAVVMAPLVEELTFRGLLFPALSKQLKRPLWAMIACGFLFACIHPQGPLAWPALMTVGGVAAYLRYYTGSLVPSIVLHAVHNGVLMTIALMLS